MIDTVERISFLEELSVFSDLDDNELRFIAEVADEVYVPGGGVIFEEGGLAENFFMIYQGRIGMTRKVSGRMKQLAILKVKDCFGESDLVLNRWRSATATALLDTSLLVLSREDFKLIYQEISKLRRRRLQRFIFINIPKIIGQVVLDIMGRDKASATTATIIG